MFQGELLWCIRCWVDTMVMPWIDITDKHHRSPVALAEDYRNCLVNMTYEPEGTDCAQKVGLITSKY